ncbi:MAG: DedA family protein, partial [Actinomycetota bacterium]|nr:DedA family protein [Actinomycetota bacterium]
MTAVLDAISQWATETMRAGGALGLALVMLVENLFPPIPSEGVLPYAGFLVSRGQLGLAATLAGSTSGSLAGALVLYAMGRWGGRPLVLRFRKVLRITERDLDRADAWFARSGQLVVLFGRMAPLARSVVSVPAGVARMPLGRFVLLTTLGSLAWNVLLIGGGMALGARWHQVSELVGASTSWVLL